MIQDSYRVKNNLKKYRKSLKITQEELANELGVTKSYLSKIERGVVDPSLMIAFLLPKALNNIYRSRNLNKVYLELNIDDFFYLEETP